MSEERIVTSRNNYKLGKMLSHGTFGIVRECEDDLGNRSVAKILSNKEHSYKTLKWRWIVEVNAMKLLRHPNILYLYDAFEYERNFYMIIERCDITLEEYLQQREIKDRDKFLKSFAPGILRAVDYIHSQNYVHKDIHAGNIYLKRLVRGVQSDNVKLGDFGISSSIVNFKREKTILLKHIKPPEFIAPEYFGELDERSDIYQLGLLFLSILKAEEKKYSSQEIVDGVPTRDLLQIETVYREIIVRMLERNSKNRVSKIVQIYREMEIVADS